jgi:hypothetical protein
MTGLIATVAIMTPAPTMLESVRALTAPIGQLGGAWMLAD